MQKENSHHKINFIVVKFVENEEVSAVPAAWVDLRLENNMCWWPGKVNKTAIIKKLKPQSDWKKYEVEIIKKCETYDGAFKIELQQARSSESERELGKGKRRIKRRHNFGDISPPPAPRGRIKGHYENVCDGTSSSSDETEYSYSAPPTTDYMKGDKENISPGTYEKTLEKFMNSTTNIDIISNDTGEQTIENNAFNEDNSSQIKPDVPINSEQILNQLTQINATLRIILNKVNALQNNTENNHVNMSDNLLPPLPCCTIDDVLNLDEKIQNDEKCLEQLEYKLIFIGGYNARNAVTRCLQLLFTNKTSEAFSWTGQKNNIRLSDMKTITALKFAIRKSFTKTTDREFEIYVMNWFRHSRQRSLRDETKHK